MLRKWFARILYSLVMIVIALIFCSPILLLLINSLKINPEITGNPFGIPFFPTFSHFPEVLRAMHFPAVFFRTILIVCATATGIVLITSMAAYALRRSKLALSRFFYPLFIFSLLVPLPSILFPLVILSRTLGLNNAIGIIPIYWGLGCPLAVLIFHSFLRGVPPGWEEAAILDGAGFSHRFFMIVLPNLKPAIIMVAIINVFRIWNDFLLPLVLLPPGTTLQLAQFGFFIQIQGRGEWGPVAASLVVSSLPILIFFIIIQKYTVKSMYAGAIKG
jgi:raffinose/stachyose/melibiose transport system permease protein